MAESNGDQVDTKALQPCKKHADETTKHATQATKHVSTLEKVVSGLDSTFGSKVATAFKGFAVAYELARKDWYAYGHYYHHVPHGKKPGEVKKWLAQLDAAAARAKASLKKAQAAVAVFDKAFVDVLKKHQGEIKKDKKTMETVGLAHRAWKNVVQFLAVMQYHFYAHFKPYLEHMHSRVPQEA
jgi:hypothetical protein